MKRIVILAITLSLIVGGAVVFTSSVQAETPPPMTEAHIARIKSGCVSAQSALSQLHASDALMRVNRGQLFESMSTRLMVPFNSRIAKYTQQNVALVEVASAYDSELSSFRTDYQQYEESMSRTLKIDCQSQPVAFYDSVAETRAKRQITHERVVALQAEVEKYKVEFEVFAKNFQEGAR